MFAIILGGWGTRLRPLTIHEPKSMLFVAGRRIIDWQIDQLKEACVTDLIITSTGNHKVALQDYLGDGTNFGINVHHLDTGYQGSAPDLARATKLIPENEKDFVLIYSDILSDANLKDLIAKHRQREPKPVVSFLYREVQYPLGVLTITEDGRVTVFDEKPQFDINEAIYVVSKDIESCLVGAEDLSTQVFRDLAGPAGKLVAYPDEAHWHHIENLETYLVTHQHPPEWLVQNPSIKER